MCLGVWRGIHLLFTGRLALRWHRDNPDRETNVLSLAHTSTFLQVRTRAKRRVCATGKNQCPCRARAPFGRYRLHLFCQTVQQAFRERIPGIGSVQLQDTDTS